ncbi:MAG: AAA family ATPase, partial [Bacteroidia bacterium]
MARKRLGIGSQTFQNFSKEKMIYVDKTELIYKMMDLGVHNFIVRPRRFGKSLFLNTVENIYQGKKELFEDTWAYNHLDWDAVKRPVLRIDFTKVEYQSSSLESGLQSYLKQQAQLLGIEVSDGTAKETFRNMIEALGKETTIVILVDEYEMPVTDFVGKDEAKLQEDIDILKKFYGTMKGMGDYIHRSYITGVSKIGKIGVLSDLNMLNDLTLNERFSTLFGYTETELRHFYAEYITEAAEKHKCTEAEIL